MVRSFSDQKIQERQTVCVQLWSWDLKWRKRSNGQQERPQNLLQSMFQGHKWSRKCSHLLNWNQAFDVVNLLCRLRLTYLRLVASSSVQQSALWKRFLMWMERETQFIVPRPELRPSTRPWPSELSFACSVLIWINEYKHRLVRKSASNINAPTGTHWSSRSTDRTGSNSTLRTTSPSTSSTSRGESCPPWWYQWWRRIRMTTW